MFALNCRCAFVVRAVIDSRFCQLAIVGELLSCSLMTGHHFLQSWLSLRIVIALFL